MNSFIVLTFNGRKVRYNVRHIINYFPSRTGSGLVLVGYNDECVYVEESVDEIDKMIERSFNGRLIK